MVPAVEIRDLTVVFSSPKQTIKAVDRLNLTVLSGQVFGFLGPNGAGKTTTMHVLLGFIPATSGEARIFGDDVRHSIARQRIGYLAEHPDTYRFLTGRELLRMTGHLFRMSGKSLNFRIDEVLEQVDLVNSSNRRTGTYSRGMLQRICLAQALINNPDLVILDEPAGGLDPIGRMGIRKIITGLRDQGKTVFFSSHELSEVELVCDHLAILVNGKLVVEGAAHELVKPGESLEKYFMRAVGART